MKKVINKISLFIVIVLSLLLTYPSNVYALTQETTYVSIDTIEKLEVGDLSISNIAFRDYSSTSVLSFGLTGTVTNNSSISIQYTSNVYYYDSNYNLIAQGYNLGTAISGTSDFNQMSNLSILGGHSVSEIYYYRLSINTADNTNASETINSTNLTPSKNNQYSSYEYVIDKYDVNIVVNENNSLDITETITAYFNVSKHGIFRKIPLKNTITRLDGTTSTNRTQITNVSVDNEYTTSIENWNYKLQIGSASRTLIGEQKYVIKYTYNLGKDPVKDYDELYYNIIGNEWDTVIGNITFSITMPKDFDSSKLGFSSGIIGSTDNSKVEYNVSGNKITGSYSDILDVGEALTIRCELPEGYFVGAEFSISMINYLMILIPIIFLGISVLLWYKYGRDDQVVETVEFYPPDGLNSLDVGLLYKGKAENKDITSLLIYLANKGYIEIDNKKIDLDSQKICLSEDSKKSANQKIIELQNKINEERKINPNSQKIKYYENMLDIYKNIDTPIDFKQYGLKSAVNIFNIENSFLIRKLKDYDGTNINERWFMEGLFEYDRTEVTEEMLYDNFYVTNNRILRNINNKQNKDKIFERSSTNKLLIIKIMLILTFTMLAIMTISNNIAVLIFVLFIFFIEYVMFFSDKKPIYKLICMIFPPLFLLFPVFVMLLTVDDLSKVQTNFDFSFDFIYTIILIIGLICIIIMRIIYSKMPKRTKYGNEMLGKLRGFKNFLEAAEKDKLESLVMQNPNYFYDILPYTYVLGISDKWINKFEAISLQAPSWYDSSNAFDVSTFGTFMNSTMDYAQSAMSSSPSSDSRGGSSGGGSSGGGSSGGGSSGGGSGGGGGGSW